MKQTTVPYVFVNGEFLGGCDAVKQLQAAGALAPKLYVAAAAHGLQSAAAAKRGPAPPQKEEGGAVHVHLHAQHALLAPLLPDDAFLDPHVQPALADGTPPAPTLFWFPEVVDSNAIRLTAIQVRPLLPDNTAR